MLNLPQPAPEAARPRSGLPPRAVRLLGAVTAGACGLAGAAIALDAAPLRPGAVALLVVGILLGEALKIDLPYRRGGTARHSLNDTAIVAGLFLLAPRELLAAALLGIALLQVLERVPPVKAAFNVAQYVLGTAAAVLTVEVLAAAPGSQPAKFGAVAVGVAVFLAIQILAVSAIIAATGGGAVWAAARRLGASASLLAAGNACLGLIAVLLFEASAWALPALAVPIVLLHLAARQDVKARIDRERSVAHVDAERRLAEVATPDAVAARLVAAAGEVLACEAAVWRHGAWVTPVPGGMGRCALSDDAPLVRGNFGPALSSDQGLAGLAPALAVGVGGGVLVVWGGDLAAAEEWLGRLGSSGRATFDRAVNAAALAEEQATLRAVVDGTGDGILVLDPEGVIRLWNPAMARLAGIAPEAAVGQPVATVLDAGPWAVPGVHDVTRAVDSAGAGDDRVWRVSVDAVRDRDRGAVHVAVVHDVTAERRVARMKDDMLAVVSHELRTPLTPIKASAQLLRRRWERIDEHGRHELLDQIERRADHLTRLVEDLLLVGQLSAGQDAQPAVVVSQLDLAANVRDNVTQLALSRPDHIVTVEAPLTLPATTDAMRVRQVVDNLVDNACKFSPRGATVAVRVAEADGWATIDVVDEGRGISPADLERVFDRFERVEDPLVMTTSGAGLGLFIVRALVQALGGDITLSSRLGQGTTAHVRIPLLRAPAPLTLYDKVA